MINSNNEEKYNNCNIITDIDCAVYLEVHIYLIEN